MSAWREVPCSIPERSEILPINYSIGSDMLTVRSKKIIDEYVYDLLKKNPNIIVEIGSHTDAQGSDAFNLNLSERRAKNVVKYMISKGVDDTRLIAVGYGETKLMNDCTNGKDCADNIHAQNRSTEFKVF